MEQPNQQQASAEVFEVCQQRSSYPADSRSNIVGSETGKRKTVAAAEKVGWRWTTSSSGTDRIYFVSEKSVKLVNSDGVARWYSASS